MIIVEIPIDKSNNIMSVYKAWWNKTSKSFQGYFEAFTDENSANDFKLMEDPELFALDRAKKCEFFIKNKNLVALQNKLPKP